MDLDARRHTSVFGSSFVRSFNFNFNFMGDKSVTGRPESTEESTKGNTVTLV